MIQLIKEEIINCNDIKHLCHPIILEYLQSIEVDLNDVWVQVVYVIKNKPIVFIISHVDKNTLLPEKSFKNFLHNTNIKSFDELLYLVTLYPHFCFDEDLSWFSNKNNMSEFNQSYLSNSKGKLIYHYQLEQLYITLTNSNIETAITFRKSINLKRKSAFDEAKSIILSNGQSLLNFIQESRIKDFTLYPKVKETMELFQFLNS